MRRAVSATELASIVSHLLTDPSGAGELDEADTFGRFMTDIAQVVADHCGGEIVSPASSTDKGWTVSVTPNDSLPEMGGVWGECEAQTHLGLFQEILDSTRVGIDGGLPEDLVVRRDLVAQEYLSGFPADLVLTRERIEEDGLFGEALHWMTPHFEMPLWEERTLGEFMRCYQSGLIPEKANALMLRTEKFNELGVKAEYVTIEALRHAVPTEAGAWRLPSGRVLSFV